MWIMKAKVWAVPRKPLDCREPVSQKQRGICRVTQNRSSLLETMLTSLARPCPLYQCSKFGIGQDDLLCYICVRECEIVSPSSSIMNINQLSMVNACRAWLRPREYRWATEGADLNVVGKNVSSPGDARSRARDYWRHVSERTHIFIIIIYRNQWLSQRQLARTVWLVCLFCDGSAPYSNFKNVHDYDQK